MAGVLIGSEAVARGVVTRHELQRWYEPIYPGVYAAKGQQLSLRDRTEGAWLWSRRGGVGAAGGDRGGRRGVGVARRSVGGRGYSHRVGLAEHAATAGNSRARAV